MTAYFFYHQCSWQNVFDSHPLPHIFIESVWGEEEEEMEGEREMVVCTTSAVIPQEPTTLLRDRISHWPETPLV